MKLCFNTEMPLSFISGVKVDVAAEARETFTSAMGLR